MITALCTEAKTAATSSPSVTARSGVLQRKCACGGAPGPSGTCAPCLRKRKPGEQSLTVQPKLLVDQPGDAYEREADRLAARIVVMSERGTGGEISRIGPGNEIRREVQSSGNSTVPPVVHHVLRSAGRPLDSDSQAFMETRLGHDFGHVRVHTDAKAAQSAQSVNALAYAVGNHVVFAHGRYAPNSIAGRQLLAHELTHTAQQPVLTGSSSLVDLQVGPVHSAQERAAEQAGRGAMQSLPRQMSQQEPHSEPSHMVRAQASGLLVIQRACEHDEAFYQAASNFCRDDTWSPITHAGKTCYREITPQTAWYDCPRGEHVCFDEEGNCESSPDRSSLADTKEADGSCTWRTYCVAEHIIVDVVPSIIEKAAEDMGRRTFECMEMCRETPWYLRGFCLQGCSPMPILH